MNVSHVINTRKSAIRYAGLSVSEHNTRKLQGHILKESVPFTMPCVVYLYERGSMQMIQKTMTDHNGSYEFTGLNPDYRWVVVAVDPARQFNAVIQDNVELT